MNVIPVAVAVPITPRLEILARLLPDLVFRFVLPFCSRGYADNVARDRVCQMHPDLSEIPPWSFRNMGNMDHLS